MWLMAALGAVAFVLLTIMAGTGMTDGFDAAVIEAVRSAALHDLLSPLRWITELGSTVGVTLVVITVIPLGLLSGRPGDGLAGAFTIGLSALAVAQIKVLVGRARPDLLDPFVVEAGFSFPSGHSTNGMVAYGVLAVLVGRIAPGRRWAMAVQCLLAVVVLLIGLSRVWLGVHHPTDVVAGWVAGAVLVIAYANLTRRAWPAPAAGAAAADRAAPRSDPPAAA